MKSRNESTVPAPTKHILVGLVAGACVVVAALVVRFGITMWLLRESDSAYLSGDHAREIECLELAHTIWPTEGSRVHLSHACIAVAVEQYEADAELAFRYMDLSIGATPRSSYCYGMYARLLIKSGKYREAHFMMNRARSWQKALPDENSSLAVFDSDVHEIIRGLASTDVESAAGEYLSLKRSTSVDDETLAADYRRLLHDFDSLSPEEISLAVKALRNAIRSPIQE